MMPRQVPGRKPPRDPLEAPEIARHSDAMRARRERYDAFERFQADAPSRLPRLYAQLDAGRFYRDYYSLCVCPGGAKGGQDHRTLQVFFGQRPFDVTWLPSEGADQTVPFTHAAGSELRCGHRAPRPAGAKGRPEARGAHRVGCRARGHPIRPTADRVALPCPGHPPS